jgi:predicted O-methyltransferase YrrM
LAPEKPVLVEAGEISWLLNVLEPPIRFKFVEAPANIVVKFMKVKLPKRIHLEDCHAILKERLTVNVEAPVEAMAPETITPKDIEALYFARIRKQLKKSGWIASAATQTPINRDGSPIPWYTYACISFLQKRVQPSFRVFEYGSGNSTLWWAERVARVVSVEHNEFWFSRISASAPENVSYIFKEKNAEYSRTAALQSEKFDVVVIDGHDRVGCARHAANALNDTGIIVWDNADRDLYSEGYDLLHSIGFRRLDFDSTGPVWPVSWTTTIFYRNSNCVGL